MSAPHRVRLIFDGGYLSAKLICPESGCEPAVGAVDDECWMRPWFDNTDIIESLNAEVELSVSGEWDGDGLILHQLAAEREQPEQPIG